MKILRIKLKMNYAKEPAAGMGGKALFYVKDSGVKRFCVGYL